MSKIEYWTMMVVCMIVANVVMLSTGTENTIVRTVVSLVIARTVTDIVRKFWTK